MKRTVDLVATRDTILKYFPDTSEPRSGTNPGIMSAAFPITPELCETELGRWLSNRIFTTRFDDDASSCKLLLPVTEFGLNLRVLGTHLMRKQELSTEEAEPLFREIEAWISKQRKTLELYGRTQSAYRTIKFEWPVFGSAKARGAVSPEAYFDECAKQIRMTGGIVLQAGSGHEPPPDSLLRTMAKDSGGGLALLERYNKSDPFGYKKRGNPVQQNDIAIAD